jgi:hypothetical protein
MDQSSQELRIELEQLLRKQSKTLEARLSGRANDMESLEYEIRQEVIREMWEQLARSAST